MSVNALLVKWAGGLTERVRVSNVATVGRIEGYLQVGKADSWKEAIRLADGDLDEFAKERTQTDVAITPDTVDDTPFVGYQPLGTRVVIDGVAHRILGMTVTAGDDLGDAQFQPQLNSTVILDTEERFARLLRRMVQGTLGGRSKVAQPALPRFIPRGMLTPSALDPCITETFTGADALRPAVGYGADFDVAEAHFAGGDYIDSPVNQTNDNTGLTVVDNMLAATILPSPPDVTGTVRSYSLARSRAELPSDDVAMSTTIGAIPDLTYADGDGAMFGLMARMEDDPMKIIQTNAEAAPSPPGTGWPSGILVTIEAALGGYFQAVLYVVGTPWTNFIVVDTAAPSFAAGDVFTLDVTGSPTPGGALRIVAAINGTAFFDFDQADIETLYGGAGVWDEIWPTGRRAGFLLAAEVNDHWPDFVGGVRMADFSACERAPIGGCG